MLHVRAPYRQELICQYAASPPFAQQQLVRKVHGLYLHLYVEAAEVSREESQYIVPYGRNISIQERQYTRGDDGRGLPLRERRLRDPVVFV